jgi:hypothetical protein
MYDFLVVGAQKCGTTSVHRYLAEVQCISLPLNKEEPFFDNPCMARDKADLHAHFDAVFGRKIDGRIYGKCSPQYMLSLDTPARILDINGNVKIIIMIRDPIDRAYSQYKMEVRRGGEDQSFEVAIERALNGDDVKGYLEAGEYCKYIDEYRRVFGAHRVYVESLEKMERKPLAVFQGILNFLDVEVGGVPENVGKVYHQGGGRRKTRFVDYVKRVVFLKWVIKKTVPEKIIKSFNYWFEQWNVVVDTEKMELSENLREELSIYFRAEFEFIKNGQK